MTRLCDLSVDGDSVTSVCWNERVSKRLLLVCGTREESADRRTIMCGLLVFQGSLVAVGTHKGYVQVWDAAGGRKLTSLEGHSARVGQSEQERSEFSEM